MDFSPSPQSYQSAIVTTIHILESGEIISSLDEYRKVEDRFSWVDKTAIVARILRLRRLTDEQKKSLIVIYENGQVIKEYLNVEPGFRPLAFY